MDQKEIKKMEIQGKINYLKDIINKNWFSYLIYTETTKEINKLEKELKEI